MRVAVAAAFMWVVSSAALGAQQLAPGGHPLTLRAAIDSALRNNPDVRTVRAVADSAHAETRIAREWANPAFASIPNVPFQYSATLPIDLGPRRSTRIATSDLGLRAAQLDVRDNARQIVLAVQRAYYDVLLADARRTIVAARHDIVRQLIAADSARVRAGDIPERTMIRSEVEGLRTEADLARAGIDAQVARLGLQALMGVASPDTALAVEGTLAYRDLDLGTDDAIRTGVANRPDVAASVTRESQSIAARQAASALTIPVPQLTYVRQFNGPFESGHYYAFGLGLEIPILNQYGGQRERADAAREAAVAARRRVTTQAEREITSALAELRAQRALVRRYEQGILARVEQNVDATRYAYTRGAASLLEVLDAVRAQQDVLTDYDTALHDYWVAVFGVEAATGIVAH